MFVMLFILAIFYILFCYYVNKADHSPIFIYEPKTFDLLTPKLFHEFTRDMATFMSILGLLDFCSLLSGRRGTDGQTGYNA